MGAPASSDEEGVRSTAANAAELAGHPRYRCLAYSAFRSRSVICVNALQPTCFDYYKVPNN